MIRLEALQEGARASPLDPEGDHEARPRLLTRGQRLVGMAVEPGIMDLAHAGLRGEPRGDRRRRRLLPVDAQGQGAQAAQDLAGIVRRAAEPGGIRPPVQLLDQRRIGGEQGAAEQIGMAVQRLGGGVEDEVAAQRRAAAAGRASAAYCRRSPARPPPSPRRRASAMSTSAEQGIARRLDPDQRRLLRQSGGEGRIVALVDEHAPRACPGRRGP